MTLFLLELREKARIFYAKHGVVINFLFKLFIALWSIYYINLNIGYNEKLDSLLVMGVIAVVGAILPSAAFPLLMAVYVLMNLYTLSLEVTITVLVVFIIMLLVYIIFMPENPLAIVLVPVLFSLNIPYLLPIVFGLIGSASTIIPLIYGVVSYYMIQYISGSATILVDNSSLGQLEKYMQLVNGIKDNPMLYAVIIAFIITLYVTMMIKSLPVEYAPFLAIVSGTLLEMIVFLMFGFLNDGTTTRISLGPVIIGCLISGVLAIIYQFSVRSVDYKRTESVQFEDDEYYYYVKAVPKIAVTKTDVQVKKIVKRDEDEIDTEDFDS